MTPEQFKEILRSLTQSELIGARKRIKKEVEEIKKVVEKIRRVN